MSSEDMKPIEAPASEHYHATEADPISLLTTEEKRGFFKGNAIKYIHRYDRKNGIEDLRKAEFYLRKLIELSEKERLMGGAWNFRENPGINRVEGKDKFNAVCMSCNSFENRNDGAWCKMKNLPISDARSFCLSCNLAKVKAKDEIDFEKVE